MPMNDDDFMAVFTGQAKVSKQRYSVIPDMGTDTSYIEQERKKNASESAIDFSFLDDDSLSTIDKLKKFWRVQTNSQTPDERLESAEKVGNALGIVPQTLAENDDLYKNALLTYEQQRNNAYLQGKPFTPQTVAQLYPELDTEDTVATTMALRDYNNVLKTRMAISQGVPVYSLAQDDSLWGTYTSAAKEGAQLPGFLFGKISDLATKAYNAGQAMDQQSELMYKASIGEISDEDVEKAIPGLLSTQKDFKTEMGDNYIARIVGEAISQLSMQKNMMMRGAEKILAPIIPLAQPVLQAAKINIPQMGAMGSAAAAGALGMSGVAAGAVATGGAALAGLLTLGTASVFVGTYRAEAGQAYWEWRTKKDKFGKSLYTREQAIGHAKRVGMVNAAIETGAWELAFKGVAKVWGNEAASAVIKNTDAMKKLIGAGRGAIRKQALLHGAKQFAKVAIPETVEEGLQSMTSDLDTNIYGKGDVSTKEIFNNALDAMVEAIPSVIGMSIGGSALGGIGAYKAMKKISGLSEMKEAVTEFKRQNENSMLQKVMELREDSSLYHKAPEAYRKTIQKQMDQVDMGTVYIDAQAAAENESTHEALNEMVEKGIVSAKELDESIKTGKPLAVESGKYMQLASEETPEILADYSTMDKGERTLHAIKEERQRYKDMVDIVTSTKEKREAAAGEKILKEHFSEDTEQGREDRATAQELLSGGLEHLQENYKTLLDDAKKAWGDLTDVGELQGYMERRKGQNATTSTEKGVDFVDIDQGDSWSHIRVSKNPDWYQDFYSDYGRAPNQRELYDIAHDKTIIENDRGDEDFKVHKQELEIAKAKVESLERVGEVIKTLDKKDLIAQTLLDPDTYEQAYKPLLEQITKAGNKEVTQAARDSALILAKLAENFHKNYGVPLKLATIAAGKVSPKSVQQLHQAARSQQGISDKASEIIKKEIKTINRNDIPADKIDRLIYSELSKKTPEELLADTVKTLKSYAKDKITDPMGDRIYLAPAKGESFEQYATHLIAGHEEKVDDGSHSRALGVKLLLQTLTNPMAIVLQDNGRKKYLAIYDDGTSRLHQIIVEAQKDENGRIVTSFVKDAKRKDKGAPYARFKNEIATSKKVLYIRGLNDRKGLSGHSRPPVEQWVSQVSANLHPIGNYIIAREELENNESPLYQMAGEHAKWEARLKEDEKKWSDTLDKFAEGKAPTRSLRVMNTPLVLQLLSAKNIPLNIDRGKLGRILRDHGKQNNQGMTIGVLKQLPSALANPLMIFTSATKPGRLVVALELKDEMGVNVVVPIQLDAKKGRYDVNIITSAYGRRNDIGNVDYKWFRTNAEQGRLEYVNRENAYKVLGMTKEKAHSFLQSVGVQFPMEAKKSKGFSPLRILDESDLVKARAKNPTYYQTAAPEKDLIVYHNVSAEKLKGAIELGGLPMPSLAITKKDIPFGDFGEITLIGNKDMIDPRKSRTNEVFSRDAYTVRKPTVNYEEPSEKDEAAFRKKYSAAKEELEKKGVQTRRMDFSAYDGLEALARMENDEVIKYYYAKNILKQDIPVKMKTYVPEVRHKKFFEDYPKLLKVLEKTDWGSNDFSKINDAIQSCIDDIDNRTKLPIGLRNIKKRRLEQFMVNGSITQNAAYTLSKWLDAYHEDWKQKSHKIVDEESFKHDMNQIIENSGFEKFIFYVQSEFDNLYKEKYLWDNGKKYKFTLDNVVKLMKKYRGTNNEGGGGINYGFNSLLAFLSKKFTSIRDIRNSKSKLASNAKELAKYKRAESLYNRLQDEAIELRGDYDESLDMDLAEFIKDTRDRKTGDMHGFPKDKSFIKHIHDFLDAADKVTTDYFEAKPARKVSFDEFSGAIVPEDTPQKMVDFLESKGIEVRKYNQDIEGDRQAKAEELAHELNVYFQTAYHGSPYSFEHFDLGSIGTGEGYRAYGWGLYFSKDRKIAQKYREMLKDKGTTGGSIYEVDIPDNDVLLDWDKPIREQPLKVKEAIIKFMKEHPDDYIADGLTPENFDDGRTGEQWYKEVGFELSIEDPTIAVSDRPRLASETLNGLGIKGITYEGREDGRCFVVFDDKAISIINRYNQEINKRYQGSYDRNQNVIEIFDGANQSTVIHEGAHMFLSMLEDMSNLDEQSLAQYFNGDEKAAATSMKRMQDDLSTIRKWASYTDEHLAEYKGTALEKEFFQHAADIADGKEGAEERWIQERFARGFEKYLMDGSAPTKEMQGVFRRFKKWLTDIYKTAKNLGNVKLTPEIKDVFDKMLATEDEINAWAAQRKLESIDKAIDVNKSELGNLKEWAESVKQKAQEKAMSYYLSMVKEDTIEQFKGSISTEEAKFDFLKSLSEENEIYTIEQVYNSDNFPTKKDKEDFLKLSGYTEETFKQKLKKSGGTSEEQWKKHIADMVQQYKDEILTPETIKQMAEDVLNSPEGLQKKSRIESMLLEKKVSQYINLVTSMQLKLKRAKDKEKVARDIRKRLGLVSEKETAELDRQADTIARSEEKISKLEKQVKTLKEKLEAAKKEASEAKDENKSRKESAELLESNLHAMEAELEKERAAHEKTQATQKDTEATVADLEGQLQTMVDGLKESRKEMWVDKAVLKKDAYNTMSLETISHATSWKWWQNKAKEADAKAMKCAAANDWDGVAYYKKVEAQNIIMSQQAKLNVDEIKKALHGGGKLTTKETDNNGMERYGILGLINRIGRKENPVLLQGDARYFIQHLAYMCGLVKSDAPKPIDDMGNPREFNFQALMDMIDPMKMKELDGAALLADGTDAIPQWVLNTYFNFDSKPGKFGNLTMNDFRDIVKCMKAVYKIGRREYEGNTLGTSFDNAAKEIINGLRNVSGLQYATSFQRKYLFTDKQKAMHTIGKYVRSLALPEMYIERLGEAAYKYLYKPIDIATTKQREMKEQAKKDIQKIFSTYSRKEWLEIRNDRKYRILGSNELFSKEEILVIALNWGTESNRDRIKDIVREVNPTYDLNKSNWAIDLQEELETYLTDKDWDFVEKVWEHLNSYYAGRSKVQNDLYGVPMGKVPGITFTLKSGRKIRGQYYTIRYDKELSQRTSEQSVNDIAKQGMKGATTFGIGMGSTKTRTGSGGQILDLSLDLYPKFVDEAIQHTTMREATVDVYKLLCRKDVEESIINVMGQDGYDFLKQWVVDNWHSPIVEANDWVGLFNRMRCKFNFATMAYRTSTALLNALNIFPLMNEMGPMNALYAVAHFYKDIPYAPGRVAERYRFIKEKSSFMRDRESNMDRDLAQGMRLPVAKGESKLHSTLENGKFGTANINRYGFWLITKTDYMLSMPQWLATYEGSKRKLQLEHPEMKLEDIDAESVRLADKAVRQTFGSGEIKDRPEIMRNGHWLGQITAFYSYTNLVANWFIRDFYKWKDTGSIRPLAESILFCWVLNAVFEGCMRAAWDDKDDDDKWKNKIANAFFNGGPIGGIPIVRDSLPWIGNYFMTGKEQGDIVPDISALNFMNLAQKAIQAARKGDYIETARNVSKISNRTYLGFSDTLSDGFWSTVRFCTTENQYTLADLLRSIIFDRPLKAETKKSKKKEDKK